MSFRIRSSMWNLSVNRLKRSNSWNRFFPNNWSHRKILLGTTSRMRCFFLSGFVYSSPLTISEYNVDLLLRLGYLQTYSTAQKCSNERRNGIDCGIVFSSSIAFTPAKQKPTQLRCYLRRWKAYLNSRDRNSLICIKAIVAPIQCLGFTAWQPFSSHNCLSKENFQNFHR